MERGLAPASLVRGLCLYQQYAVASSLWPCRLSHFFAADWHAAGGGLTLGVSKADTVMVLNTEAALEQFKRDTDFKLGAGLSVDCESMLPATEACVPVCGSCSRGIAAGQQRLPS